MKNIKTIAVVVAAVAMAATVTFVACEKNNTDGPAVNTSSSSAKATKASNQSSYDIVYKDMLQLYKKIDEAYQSDPEGFERLCEENQWESFSEFTGIKVKEMKQLVDHINMAREDYLAANPGFEPGQGYCEECATRPYSRIASVARSSVHMGGMGTVAAQLEPEDVMQFTVMCAEACYPAWVLGPEAYGSCVLACVAAMCLMSD